MSIPPCIDTSLLPDWVNWLAQDADGTWWGYSIEPLQHTSGWYENEAGDYIRLSSGTPEQQWQNTLLKVPRQG